MQRLVGAVLIGALALVCLAAGTGFNPFRQADGTNVSGQVLLCVPGEDRLAVPCGSPGRPIAVASVPASSTVGGLDVYRVNSPAGAPGLTAKPAAGRLYSYNLCNTAGASRFVRFYDSMAPVPGTTPIYAGPVVVSAGTCQQFATNFGLSFANAISIGITGANGDADATPVSAGDVSGFLGFQ